MTAGQTDGRLPARRLARVGVSHACCWSLSAGKWALKAVPSVGLLVLGHMSAQLQTGCNLLETAARQQQGQRAMNAVSLPDQSVATPVCDTHRRPASASSHASSHMLYSCAPGSLAGQEQVCVSIAPHCAVMCWRAAAAGVLGSPCVERQAGCVWWPSCVRV